MTEHVPSEVHPGIQLGARVNCRNGVHASLEDVILNPLTRQVTHVAITSSSFRHKRLVPLSELELRGGQVSLDSDAEALEAYPRMDETSFVERHDAVVADPGWAVGIRRVLARPYYQFSHGFSPVDDEFGAMTWDRVPAGEIEIRRESRVKSADVYDLGHVQGFVLDGPDITHIVLEHGPTWLRDDVVVPIGAAEQVTSDQVLLSLNRSEVEALPHVRVHRWDHGQSDLD